MKTTIRTFRNIKISAASLALAALVSGSVAALPALADDSRALAGADQVLAARLANPPSTGWTSLIAAFDGKITPEQKAQITKLGGYVYRHLPLIDAAAVRVPSRNLTKLAALPFIKHLSTDAGVKKHDEFTVEHTGTDVAVSEYSLTGSGIAVAVIDSGVANHQDFNNGTMKGKGRVVRSVDYVGDGLSGDPLGHGTHVAGIIAGNGYSSTGSQYYRTFYGMARAANIVSVRVLDRGGYGTVSNVIAGINWVVQNRSRNNIRVINLSLGHPVFESYTTDPLCQAVESAWKAGIVVVCSAGNTGRNSDVQDSAQDNEGFGTRYGSIQSPGNSPYVITVGAMKMQRTATGTTSDLVATYSSRGPARLDMVMKPDIIAPGNRVIALNAKDSYLYGNYITSNMVQEAEYSTEALSADVPKEGGAYSSRYFRLSGTSMAAPVVAGAVTLLLERDPTLSPDTIKARLMVTADKWTFADGTTDPLTFGAGRLNVLAALRNYIYVPEQRYALSPVLDAGEDGKMYVVMDRAIWGGNGMWETGVMDLRAIWGRASFEEGSANVVTDLRAIWGRAYTVEMDRAIWGRASSANSDVTGRAIYGEQ